MTRRNVLYLSLAFVVSLPCLWARALGDDAGVSLFSNPDFEAHSKEAGWPDDWPHHARATWEKEGDKHFLRLKSAKPGEMVMLYRQVSLPSPLPPALEIRLRVRYTNVKPGEKPWNDVRVIGHFLNEAGKILKPEPECLYWSGSSEGWVDRSYIVKVPAHCRVLAIMPSLFQPASGTLDLARVEVRTVTAAQMPKLIAIPSTTIVPAQTSSLPKPLHVVGNQLLTPDGKPVWLQGLSVDSLQWSLKGENIEKSIPVAINQWKSNVIRLAVMKYFWNGKGLGQPHQHPKDGGLAYRQVVDAAVEAAASRGAYLVLDLHEFGAPLPEDIEFWKDAALRYKNHPAVIFELFNEPHSISWKLWRDGGDLTDAKNKNTDVNPKENNQQATGEVCRGMQALIDAVRSTGAKNIVIAGGLDWGHDLSGVVNGFALDDRGGNGIMYSSHLYPWKKDWQKKTLDTAAKYPVFVGEVSTPGDWTG
jgi:endoglucanase